MLCAGVFVMKQALLSLTSLRFFAALAVIGCHRPRVAPDDWLPYERFGSAGVPFFFLLSGFILAYTYHDRFLARRPGTGREFLLARFARIFPAYLLAFLISLWVAPQTRDLISLRFGAALWQAIAHLTMMQAYCPNMNWYFGFNPPAWSLSCEWTFYLLFPVLLLGLVTGSVVRRLAVFAAASAVWAGALYLYLSTPGDPVAEYKKWAWFGYIFPLTRLFDFVCGIALGVLFVRARPEIGPARGWRYGAWGAAEVGALAALWAALHFCPVSPGVYGSQTFHTQMLTWQGYFLPFFAAIVWVGALGRGPLSRVLSWSPLVYLGELSYGIYIFHLVVIFTVTHSYSVGLIVPPALAPAIWAWCAGITLAVSVLSFHFWETPMRRWLRGRPRQPVADESRPPVVEFPQPDRRAA